MARSLLNAKLLPYYVPHFVFSNLTRRGYAARVGLAKLGDHQSEAKIKGPAVIRDDSGALSWWVPDPVTGFYKPSHRVHHLHPAQLRANMALNRTTLKQK